MKCEAKKVVCLNFQGSKGNNVITEDGTAFNILAMHGHDVHVVCFQQNQREEVRNMGDCAGALIAESGMHNTNYVCYAMTERQISMMVGENVANTVVSTDYKGSQVVVYEEQ